MASESKARRRFLPRYSLRTLFVIVTVMSVWIGWATSIARARKQAIQDFESQGMFVYYEDNEPFPSVSIPIWRRWLGDRAVRSIDLKRDYSYWAATNHHHPEWERLHSLFPEASVGVVPSWGTLERRTDY